MRRAMGLGALVAVLLLAAVPLSATADTSLQEHGWTGDHWLVDTQASPGAWCGYVWDDEYPLLYLVRVEPPVVFARDRTATRDHQRVSWRVVLTAYLAGEGTSVVAVSPYRLATAWDDTPAALSRIIVRYPFPGFETDPMIRAWVDIRWHAPGDPSHIKGWSRHRVDTYQVNVFEPVTVARCRSYGQS